MSLFKEFKDFAMRGNVVDLAVGVVIGGAFGKIVTALVDKMIMPVVGLLLQGVNIADLNYTPPVPDGSKIVPPTLGYGAFLQEIVNFTIIAFAIFMMVKVMNTIMKKAPPAPAAPAPTPEDVLLLREIRDSLSKSAPRRAE
jgi:large conductance mechanosensitive channel